MTFIQKPRYSRLLVLSLFASLPFNAWAASDNNDMAQAVTLWVAAFLISLSGGLVSGRGWLGWKWSIPAVFTGGYLLCLALGKEWRDALLPPFSGLCLAWPLGWEMAKSKVVRGWGGGVMVLAVALLLMGYVFGFQWMLVAMFWLFAGSLVCMFVFLAVLGAIHTWRYKRVIFCLQMMIFVIGIAYGLWWITAREWSLQAVWQATSLGLIASILLFIGGMAKWRLRSGSSSSSGASHGAGNRSGGGGSSGGGGASRSW